VQRGRAVPQSERPPDPEDIKKAAQKILVK
jgi:hypothetical protein